MWLRQELERRSWKSRSSLVLVLVSWWTQLPQLRSTQRHGFHCSTAGHCRSKSFRLYTRRLGGEIRCPDLKNELAFGLGWVSVNFVGTVLTYIRTCFVPREDGAGWDDDLVVGQAEAIRTTQICCLAANARAGALGIVGIPVSDEAIASDLARELFVCCLRRHKPEVSQGYQDCERGFHVCDQEGERGCCSARRSWDEALHKLEYCLPG
jgi:hypothetical protein